MRRVIAAAIDPWSGKLASGHRLSPVSIRYALADGQDYDLQVNPRPYGPLPEVVGLVKFLSCGLSLALEEFSENEDALPPC